MTRTVPLLLFVCIIFLHSCFATRQQKSAPDILLVDPVERALDTTRLKSVSDVSDTVNEVAVCESVPFDQIPDTIPVSIDTLGPTGPLNMGDSLTIAFEERDSTPDMVVAEIPDTIRIIGTGDIMPGTNFPDERYLPPGNDCASLFSPVKEFLQDADVTFGNLEGVFCSEGGTPKKCKNPDVCYVFRMPDEYLDCILDAGYDVLSVANNHVNDFGLEGRIKTVELLEASGVPFAGFRSRPSTVFEVDGVKFGFAAFAPHIGTLNLKDYEAAAAIVAGLDSIADIVIVSFHGGAEGKDYQHVPCTDEEYLGYNRGNVCRFAHTVVDAGADVVFGHGPHVIRAMELYKERLICYSLGNFCTYARFNLSGPNGLAPIVNVETDKSGRFIGGKIIPVFQSGEGGPRLDTRKLAIAKLRELNAADFPESKLKIDISGEMSIKE